MVYLQFDERSEKAFESLEQLRQEYPLVYDFLGLTEESFKKLEDGLKNQGIKNDLVNKRCRDMYNASNLVDILIDHIRETYLDYVYRENPGFFN